MIRETIYVCTCRSAEGERTARVLAWDEREAAELFVRELEHDGATSLADVRVRTARRGEPPVTH